MSNLWEKLMVGLDEDQRIVFPKMYLDNKNLYDKICGIGYLIKTPQGLDWVWENGIDRIREMDDCEILKKVLIVRLRLPWNRVRDEWLTSQEELNTHRKEYKAGLCGSTLEILDVYVRGAPKNDPTNVRMLEPIEFEANRDAYNILETKYYVCWKLDPEQIERLLDIRR